MHDWLTAHGGGVLDVLWDLIAVIGVPITAAAVAAYFVVRQMRQSDKHRREDRQAEAIIELCKLLTSEAAAGLDLEVAKYPALNGFRRNEHYIRAVALLDQDDMPVVHWVAAQRDEIHRLFFVAVESKEIAQAEVGPAREQMLSIAAHAMERLLEWQRGDIPTRWFRSQASG